MLSDTVKFNAVIALLLFLFPVIDWLIKRLINWLLALVWLAIVARAEVWRYSDQNYRTQLCYLCTFCRLMADFLWFYRLIYWLSNCQRSMRSTVIASAKFSRDFSQNSHAFLFAGLVDFWQIFCEVIDLFIDWSINQFIQSATLVWRMASAVSFVNLQFCVFFNSFIYFFTFLFNFLMFFNKFAVPQVRRTPLYHSRTLV